MTGGQASHAGVSGCVTPALTNDPPMASQKLSNTARRIIYCWDNAAAVAVAVELSNG
jgi:hypothetical protein